MDITEAITSARPPVTRSCVWFLFCRNCHIRTQLTLLSNRNPGVGSTQLPQSPPRGGIFIFLILRYLILKCHFSLHPLKTHDYHFWKVSLSLTASASLFCPQTKILPNPKPNSNLSGFWEGGRLGFCSS